MDNDICQPDRWRVLNVFEETNGLDGLQRQDEWIDDTCHGQIAPDTRHAAIPS